jgi:DNA-binding MarR family transcriptional regulator
MPNDEMRVEASQGLKELFSEVVALSIRLRTAAPTANGEDTLAAGGLSVLRVLKEHGAQTVPQIARLRGTSRQNIQILVNKLKAEACIAPSLNPAHKRSVLVELTGAGQELLALAVGQEASFLTGLASAVSAAEVESATSLLRQLRQLLPKAESAGMAAPDHLRTIPERGLPRVAPRKLPPPANRQQPTPAVLVPSVPESDEADLPYNLL